MSLLHVLPLLLGAVLAAELVYFGLLRPALRRAFLPSAAAGFGIVLAWAATLHGSLAGALAGVSLAGLAHGADLWLRRRL